MQNNDKGFRDRQRKLINEKTHTLLEYRAKHLDEKIKERFRREPYSVGGKSLFGIKGYKGKEDKDES